MNAETALTIFPVERRKVYVADVTVLMIPGDGVDEIGAWLFLHLKEPPGPPENEPAKDEQT